MNLTNNTAALLLITCHNTEKMNAVDIGLHVNFFRDD